MSLLANGISPAGLTLSEAKQALIYIIAFHNKEVEKAESNPFAQVTTRLLTFEEWAATGGRQAWETDKD
jgi:hypothetical protein